MTIGPAGPAGGGTGPLRPQAHGQPGTGDGPDHDEDVLFVAGQRPPADGAWLLVTGVEGVPGGKFTAQVLPGAGALAFGGDVVVRVDPDDPAAGQPPPAARVQVYAVAGGQLVPVAYWPAQDLDAWPEQIRPAVAFARGVLTELKNTTRISALTSRWI